MFSQLSMFSQLCRLVTPFYSVMQHVSRIPPSRALLLQLDKADDQKYPSGRHHVEPYAPGDNSIELLKVPHHCITARPPYKIPTPESYRYQAETMHKMVETFEYDGEQFVSQPQSSIRLHTRPREK